MKPITNLLLLAALICYIFLPFYQIAFQGEITGLDYTAGMISDYFSVHRNKIVVYAMLPFISSFGAISFNCMKNRRWGYIAILFILAGMYFFYRAADFHEPALHNAPNALPDDFNGRGFPIEQLGVGFRLSRFFMALSLISAIMSLLPLKINKKIEDTLDTSIERGIEESKKQFSKMGHGIQDEFTKLENISHRKKAVAVPESQAENVETPAVAEETPEAPQPETDHSAYMPKNQDENESEC